jgi:hypothetical protein
MSTVAPTRSHLVSTIRHTDECGSGKPTDSGDPALDIGFQAASDQVVPLEEVVANGVVRLGAEFDLQYGTVGCFIRGLDQLQSHQQTGYSVTLLSWKLNDFADCLELQSNTYY